MEEFHGGAFTGKGDDDQIGCNNAVGLHVMKFIWLVEDHLALMECELLILGGD